MRSIFSRRAAWFVSISLILCSGLAVLRLGDFVFPHSRPFSFSGFSSSRDELYVDEYFKNHQYDEAIRRLTATIESRPRFAKAYRYRGLAHLWKHENDKALNDINEAIGLEPTNPDYYADRGLCYQELGNFDQAIADLTRAVNESRHVATNRVFRGEVYASQGEYDKAIADYDAAIQANPSSSRAYDNRALAYIELNQLNKALSDVDEAIRIRPSRAEYYSTRGSIYKKMGRYRDARADYWQSIRLDPAYGASYMRLAWLLATCPEADLRDAKQAIENAKKASELLSRTDPHYAYNLETLAAAYAADGQFQQAVDWQKRALESPHFPKQELEKAKSRLQLYEKHLPFREQSQQ